MVSSIKKRSLFGGALRCAGVATVATLTSSALAEFVPAGGPTAQNYTLNFANSSGGVALVFDYDINNTGGFPGPTYSNDLLSSSLQANANATQMRAHAYIDPAGSEWAYAGAVVLQYFTVDQGKSAQVYWDLGAATLASFVEVYQIGAGDLLYEVGGSIGSINLTFLPGETYVFFARAALDGPGFAGVSMFWQVPAPGALAMLGLGMLGTRRRRRC